MQPVQAVHDAVHEVIVGYAAVIDQQHSARLQHSHHFVDGFLDVAEVMRGAPASHQIVHLVVKRLVIKGQLVDVAQLEANVAHASILRQARGSHQHFWCQVDGNDKLDVGSEGEGGVSRACGNVQNAPTGLRLGDLDQPGQNLRVGVR